MPDELPTFERLARVLEAEGLPELAARARAYEFDDYLGDSPMPQTALAAALADAGRLDLRERVIAGEWDGTAAESAAWAVSAEGQGVLGSLVAPGGPGDYQAEPAERVAAAATVGRYDCRYPGCSNPTSSRWHIACDRHWFLLPPRLRGDLQAAFNVGGPSRDYMQLCDQAVEHWQVHEAARRRR